MIGQVGRHGIRAGKERLNAKTPSLLGARYARQFAAGNLPWLPEVRGHGGRA